MAHFSVGHGAFAKHGVRGGVMDQLLQSTLEQSTQGINEQEINSDCMHPRSISNFYLADIIPNSSVTGESVLSGGGSIV